MKETIYTIPINEAFDQDCSCPLCLIQERLEKEQIEYVQGPAMMEPDFRIISNEKGFCKSHYNKIIDNCQALPASLILQTHLQLQNNKIFKKADVSAPKKSVFHKLSKKESAQSIIDFINNLQDTCIICEKINSIMSRYLENLIYIWNKENDFKAKFSSKKGFCLPHFSMLLKFAIKELNEKNFEEFYNTILNMQIKAQNNMYDDVCAFVKLFDHNSDKNATPQVKNSIRRCIKNLSGLNREND